MTVSKPVTVQIENESGGAESGVNVYAFDETTYTSYHKTSDANGEATFTLPLGNYRFRADFEGTQYWSGASNSCTIPGCETDTVVVGDSSGALRPENQRVSGGGKVLLKVLPSTPKRPLAQESGLVLTVADTDGTVMPDLNVYAFDETTYTGHHGVTDENGEVTLTLPDGDYRFRADFNGTHFWSGESNHCTTPGCTEAAVTVTVPMTVTVSNTDVELQEGLNVYAFDGTTYTGYHGVTDAQGEVEFTLPDGDYRFRADFNGTHFWSGESNHCTLPGCTEAAVTVTIPVTVNVEGQTGVPYPDLNVYAFNGDTYTGCHGVTDANGQVTLTLPQGDYHFRADYDGVQFWSSIENDCTLPGCTEAAVILPGGQSEDTTTITYTYDPLGRLTAADYDDGTYFHYTYDAVGNRLTQETQDGTTTYVYDNANRLTSVDGVQYTWDANGNLLSDGVSTYTYNYANRLISVTGPESTSTFSYNGFGDRLQQTVDGVTTNYTLDLNIGLTQVLSDGTNTYLYGNGRISQHATQAEYFLGDALGSIRQIVDGSAEITLAQSYDPYGVLIQTAGSAQSSYGYTGEMTDSSGLVHLRARYYSPSVGRFTQRDPSRLEANLYLYAGGNPVMNVDPSGLY